MTFKAMFLLSSAALALASCHKNDAEDAPTTNTVATAPDAASNVAAPAPATSAGQTFANTAAASDAFEIEASKLALTSATTPAIKAFAKKMIEAHTDSTAKLKAAAASATPGITPDPSLSADQQQMLDGLKAETGAAFDHAYVADQVTAHQKTLDALKAYSTGGDVQALKMFAGTLIPIVTAHLNMANGIKG